jgi:hypothetical protein
MRCVAHPTTEDNDVAMFTTRTTPICMNLFIRLVTLFA